VPDPVNPRRWIVRGRVQGVFYRVFTRDAARELGLRGWVRNLHDGTVEVRVGGDAGVLAAFRARLLQGPPSARVHAVDEVPLSDEPGDPAGAWTSFTIRP